MGYRTIRISLEAFKSLTKIAQRLGTNNDTALDIVVTKVTGTLAKNPNAKHTLQSEVVNDSFRNSRGVRVQDYTNGALETLIRGGQGKGGKVASSILQRLGRVSDPALTSTLNNTTQLKSVLTNTDRSRLNRRLQQ